MNGKLMLCLLLSLVRSEEAEPSGMVRRRSEYQPFTTKPVKASGLPFQYKTRKVVSQTDVSPPERRLNMNEMAYQGMMETGRPPNPRTLPRFIPGDECNIFAEFYPGYYTLISRRFEFTVRFSSNCMQTLEISFETNFRRNQFVNWFAHPTRAFINLWGNRYRIDFRNPALIDEHDIMRSWEYRSGQVSHLFAGQVKLNLRRRNAVSLDPQTRNAFNEFNIQKLSQVRGFVPCRLRLVRQRGWRGMRINRDRFIAKQRRQGVPEELIRKFLKNKRFSPTPERRLNQGQPAAAGQQEKKKKKGKGGKKGQKSKRGKAGKGGRPAKVLTAEERRIRELRRQQAAIQRRNRQRMMERRRRDFIRSVHMECSIV